MAGQGSSLATCRRHLAVVGVCPLCADCRSSPKIAAADQGVVVLLGNLCPGRGADHAVTREAHHGGRGEAKAQASFDPGETPPAARCSSAAAHRRSAGGSRPRPLVAVPRPPRPLPRAGRRPPGRLRRHGLAAPAAGWRAPSPRRATAAPAAKGSGAPASPRSSCGSGLKMTAPALQAGPHLPCAGSRLPRTPQANQPRRITRAGRATRSSRWPARRQRAAQTSRWRSP